MQKAEKALKSAPGVLAVKVDYDTKLAEVGTNKNQPVATKDLLAALESIGYQGELVRQPPQASSK